MLFNPKLKILTTTFRLPFYTLLLFFLGLLVPNSTSGQEFIEDIANIFEFDVGPERSDSTFKHAKAVLAPIVSFEPSTNWGFGIGAKFLFKPKNAGPETRTSIFFPDESYLLKGVLAFSKFPLPFFGVGSGTKSEDQVDISFNQFIFEPLLLKKVIPNFFIGGGWRLNTFRQVELLEESELFPEDINIQDSLGSISSGLEFAITIDSRDNVLNASKGVFAEFTHGVYNEAFGSSSNFMLTSLDFRKYFTVSENRPNDVIAFEIFTRFSWNDTPILELSSLGGPELLRGYQEGRFRDRHAFFGQVEYRWQALERIGLVFFGGIGEVFDEVSEIEFGDAKYSLGTGLRLKIVKSENLNIRIDFALGLGRETDQNFYLGIAEAF